MRAPADGPRRSGRCTPDEHDEPRAHPASDRGHDLRVVRDPDREAPEQARWRRGDRQLRDRERRGQLRPCTGWARGARGRGWGRGLSRDARPTGSRGQGANRGRSGRAAAAAVDRLRGPLVAGAAAGDDRAAAVRLLAVALAAAGDSGRALGRLAVPPRCVAQPEARDRDDGHADLCRHARGVGLVARCPVLPRRRRDRDDDGLRARPQPGRDRRASLSRGGRGRDHLHPRRPLLRGSGEATRGSRIARSARAGRQGGERPRRRRPRAAHRDRRAPGRRPIRRPAGREDRHRRRRRGGQLRGRQVAPDRRKRAGRGTSPATRSSAPRSTPAAVSSFAPSASAPTPRSRRSLGSSPRRSRERRPCSAWQIASPVSSSRS